MSRVERQGGATARTSLSRFVALVVVSDALTIASATVLAAQVRGHWAAWGQVATDPTVPSLAAVHGPWIGAIWLSWLAARAAYSRRFLASASQQFNRLVIASLLTAGTVAMICYMAKYDLSRGFVSLTFLIGTPLLLVSRLGMRRALNSLRHRGHLRYRAIVVGDPSSAAEVTEILTRESSAPYTVVAVLASGDDVRTTAESVAADTILVAQSQFADSAEVRRIAWSLEGTRVELVVLPSLTEVSGPRVEVVPVAGLPLLHVAPPQAGRARRWGKRSFDLAGSMLLLVLGLPLWLATAIAIMIDDGGPILFRQRRVGLHGKRFDCLKFRSMSVDAEEKIELVRHLNESDGPLFKIRQDPRVTRAGKFIRRFSLDEVPQLLNVLRGEMSLVGPRPQLPGEVATYDIPASRRLEVRPGMTGLWQVSGRAALSWRDSVRLDLYYVDNWSLLQDLSILARTFGAVMRGHGAS